MAILILAMDPFSQQVLYYASQASDVENAIATIPSGQFYDSGALYAALSGSDGTASYNPHPKPPSHPDSEMTSLANDCATCRLASPSTFGSAPLASEVPGLSTFGTVKREEMMPGSAKGMQAETKFHEDADRHTSGQSNCSDTLMARAAYAGLFTSVPPAEFTCPSGNNCTWPSFTTLGICSECNDITSRVKPSCHTKNEYDICWYELIGAGDLPGNATYPGPNKVPYPPRSGYDPTKFVSWCSNIGVMGWPLWFTWASNVWDKSLDLLSFTSYRFPLVADARASHCKLPDAHVDQCSLFWCARTFDSAAVTNGKMDEGPSKDVRLVPFNATNTTCLGLRTTKAPERKTGIPMQGLVREDRACPMSNDDIGPSDIFWVNENDHVMTVNMLSPMIWAKEMFVDPNGAMYGDQSSSAASDPAVATALWDNHGGNLSLTLADIATAMTNRVRLADGHVDVEGSSTANHTVIKVVWYWLICMVAMVLLSLTFFVTAMVFASEKSEVVWKSSSLAVLMHGLEGFDRSQLDHRSTSEMGTAAKEFWAQLKEDDEGSLKLLQHR